MRQDQYQLFVLGLACKTDVNLDRTMSNMLHGAIGLAGESGELLDALKKHVYYKQELDTTNVLEELGDAYFYMTLLAESAGFSMDDVREANVRKLTKRYPDGFTAEACANRDKDAERAALEESVRVG